MEYINAQRPSDAYMRLETRQSLVQIMVCRLFGGKPLFVNWAMGIKLYKNTTIFMEGNVLENASAIW